MNIKELIEDPSKLNAETLPKLKALVEKYPFFQVVRLLYISNLYKLHSQDFGAELRKASSFVPDRPTATTSASKRRMRVREPSHSLIAS